MKRILGANLTLMRKLIKYFFIIILVMFLLNMYSIFEYSDFYRDFYLVLRNLVDVHYISIEVNKMYEQVVNYVLSGSNEYLTDYHSRYSKLHSYIDNLQIYNEASYYHLHDVQNMIISFNEAGIRTILSYDEKLARIYINDYVAELAKHKNFIDNEVKNIIIDQIFIAQHYYSVFWQEIQVQAYIVYIVTAIITLSCILLAFRFSKKISIPIHELAQKLKKVVQGEFFVQPIKLKTNDEVNVLIESFNTMLSDIHHMIISIQEKASIEKQLKEQEIKNLEMTSLLRQSELKILQSQINPHFLFNTLNSIETLADLEEANQTSKMVESLSKILRSNLKNIYGYVSLQEEYENVKNYLYIQKVRFGNRFVYTFDVDQETLAYRVPTLIIQPFVENAVVHGLEQKDGKGHLELKIKDHANHIEIVIEDDGKGFSLSILEKLNEHHQMNTNTLRHGIGINNVVRRLEIEYGKNVVEIQSIERMGTRVIIQIPKIK